MVVTNVGAPKPAELLGRRIAGYVLDEVIGAGGMGAIYGATSRFVRKRAAVKVMLNEYTEDTEIVGRFLQEAFVASAVDHPNIIEIWAADRFEEDGRMYILMPLIEGTSLERLCESVGPLGFDTATTIALQMAAGLEAVHKLGVVHRDIKPANVLITRKDGLKHFVKIVDFGVARLLAPHVVGTSTNRRTRTNMVIGTAGSMAPEQAAGARDVDARADIYSWGVVLYRMLTGRPPYQGDSVWDLVERARKGESFPRPRELRPDIPRACEDVIMASLEFYPHKRPGSMMEVAKAIADALPNGEMMLITLARNLLPDAQIGASDKTLSGDLEERWLLSRTPRNRRSRAVPVAMALVLGAGIAGGAAVVKLVTETRDDEASRPGQEPRLELAAGSAAPDAAPDAALAIDASSAALAASSGSGGSTGSALSPPALPDPPSIASGSNARSDASGSTHGTTAPRPPTPTPTSSGKAAGSAAGDPSARPPASQVAQTGVLIVRSSPWAKVWVNDEALGQTAVRKVVRPGTYRIRLVGPDDKIKEFTRDVKAGETVPIRWDW